MNSRGVHLFLHYMYDNNVIYKQKNCKFLLVFDCEWNNQRRKDKFLVDEGERFKKLLCWSFNSLVAVSMPVWLGLCEAETYSFLFT